MRFGWGPAWHTVTWRAGIAGNSLRTLFARLPFSGDGLSSRLGSSFWRGIGAVVLGAMLAKWVWILFAPPVVAVAGIVDRGAPGEADMLFGVAPSDGDARASGVLPNVRLAGVYAGVPGFAILELDGNKQVGVTQGGEVVHGVRLAEIAADHVVLEGGGARQRVDLTVGRSSVLAPAMSAASLPPGVMPPGAMPNGLPADARETIRRELTARGLP